MNSPLPPILANKFGHLHHIKQRTHNEWSSECPVCSSSGHRGNDAPDRFRMFNDAKPLGWCRRCGHTEFAEDNESWSPDPEKIKELEAIRKREQEKENDRLQAKIAKLVKEAYWRGFHDAMTNDQREHWRKAGIPNEFMDFWELGFVAEKTINFDGNYYTSPALSIPYFENGRKPTNIQYRLLSPPNPSDKYRFSYGLRPGLWLADPDTKPSGRCLLLEGMKKTAVSFIELVAKNRQNLSVVGVPSKTPNLDMVSQLNDCEQVLIALDPDAYVWTVDKFGKKHPPAVKRLGAMLGNRARYVRLPAKADDLFVDYGFSARDFMRFVDAATV